jgi:uncharacterized coiled-coil protein SlyX
MIGADIQFFSPKPPNPSVRTQYGVLNNERVIVYHGSLNEFNRPAIQNLCLAVGLMRERGFLCRLFRSGMYALDFLGELPVDTALAITDLGLLPRSALPDLLALADVFVQPGTPDPFEDLRLPGKIAEFFAMGRPVIMPNANVAGLFRDGVDAVFLHTGNPEEIASRCVELFTDPERAAKIGQAGRLIAEKYFDVRIQAKRLEDSYNAAIEAFDSVVAASIWSSSNPYEPVTLALARKLKLLGDRTADSTHANLLRHYAQSIEQLQNRLWRLDATVTERDQEIASLKRTLAQHDQTIAALKQALAEFAKTRNPRWPFLSDHLKAKLNRLRAYVRRLPSLLVP